MMSPNRNKGFGQLGKGQRHMGRSGRGLGYCFGKVDAKEIAWGRVENLENDKADQKLEIIKLKARVKKLEIANKVKSSKLRRLRKVGVSRRIESSDGMDDVFNHGRMIEIYHIDLDHSSKVLSMQEDDLEVQEVVEVVTTAKLIKDVVTAASQVTAASATISAVKPSIPAAALTV
nr:hypothetical protein [Tanacetum cinerariifolium]